MSSDEGAVCGKTQGRKRRRNERMLCPCCVHAVSVLCMLRSRRHVAVPKVGRHAELQDHWLVAQRRLLLAPASMAAKGMSGHSDREGAAVVSRCEPTPCRQLWEHTCNAHAAAGPPHTPAAPVGGDVLHALVKAISRPWVIKAAERSLGAAHAAQAEPPHAIARIRLQQLHGSLKPQAGRQQQRGRAAALPRLLAHAVGAVERCRGPQHQHRVLLGGRGEARRLAASTWGADRGMRDRDTALHRRTLTSAGVRSFPRKLASRICSAVPNWAGLSEYRPGSNK